jgi:uncharacterized DUF497 family protein
VNFEWDEEKNQENTLKHGLDFADAWEIFDAPMITALDTREDYGEDRWIGVGFLKNFVVVVVYTESDEVIRLISLRKALKHERTRFEEALKDELGEG